MGGSFVIELKPFALDTSLRVILYSHLSIGIALLSIAFLLMRMNSLKELGHKLALRELNLFSAVKWNASVSAGIGSGFSDFAVPGHGGVLIAMVLSLIATPAVFISSQVRERKIGD